MTLERASEIFIALHEANSNARFDLFEHFVEYFELEGERLCVFAELCKCAIVAIED